MRAAEYHAELRCCGEELLAPAGFVYRKRAWHLSGDGFQLSLCPSDTKFGIGFAVKYLTVALWHLELEPPASARFLPCDNNCSSCPVRISPLLLGPHLASGLDESVWDCPDPLDFDTRLKTCLPVYFGGEDFPVLADPAAGAEANRRALLHALERDGIDELSEASALRWTREAVGAVARHGLVWASAMTVERVAPWVERTAARSADIALYLWAPQYAGAARAG